MDVDPSGDSSEEHREPPPTGQTKPEKGIVVLSSYGGGEPLEHLWFEGVHQGCCYDYNPRQKKRDQPKAEREMEDHVGMPYSSLGKSLLGKGRKWTETYSQGPQCWGGGGPLQQQKPGKGKRWLEGSLRSGGWTKTCALSGTNERKKEERRKGESQRGKLIKRVQFMHRVVPRARK